MPVATPGSNLFRDIMELLEQEKPDAAEALLREALVLNPGNFGAHFLLGAVLENKREWDSAIDVYGKASKLNPGDASPFSRQVILLLRRHWGLAPNRPPSGQHTGGNKGRICMSSLGTNGRFGNQLLQYGFLRMVAEEFGLSVEVPEWVGRYLYDLDNEYPLRPLPMIRENGDSFVRSLNRNGAGPLVNCDLWGYCCYHTGRLSRYRDLFRALYKPGQRLRPIVDKTSRALRRHGKTVVALHLRRSDFGKGKFWIAPESWYVDWLETLWEQLDKPVLYIASDDPGSVLPAFQKYDPITVADVGVAIPGGEFIQDFHVLVEADCVAISNSTFSFAASMLNHRAMTFSRPEPGNRTMVNYDPWNANVLLAK